ncbi:hypothetical protein GCM10009765_46020 [Fodinicola feengrottensis]|uniref:Glycosyltransferase family 2 protein n=2 Tax=Fodinicola feengrottensis TaxID=435914 RepID=A0ABN2HPS9_9ACTN
MPSGERIGHHYSHAQLLVSLPGGLDHRASLDAIVVPTARTPQHLDNAIALARTLDCSLLVLCSKDARADWAAERASGVKDCFAVDIGAPRMPRFETSGFLPSSLSRRTDTSLKRNVGLAVAVMAGWRRVVFLDDDMVIQRAENVLEAVRLLDELAAVGLKNDGFPDNSVVCHALRAVGKRQDSFIGGGALAVVAGPNTSFFPTVYNEDWFFLLDSDDGLNPVTVAGAVTQEAFNPYENPDRAASEEFGDCLAEGVYALLDNGGSLRDADDSYWQQFLKDRSLMIADIQARTPGLAWPLAEKNQLRLALEAALGQLARISPQHCTSYLDLWQRDRKRWRDYLGSMPVVGAPEALRRLGMVPAKRQGRFESRSRIGTLRTDCLE